MVIGLAVRLHNYPDGGRYSSIGTGYFAADSAMRYRYARMFAAGEEVPEIDQTIQYPEGLRVRSLEFLLVDRWVGDSYRFVRWFHAGLDFDTYLRWIICIFGVLTAVPVFLLARLLWREPIAALFGTGVYLVSIPSFSRSVGSYLREEFTLPFLGMTLYLLLKSIQRDSLSGLLAAGGCLLIGLSMWHTTPFFFLILIAFLISYSLIRSDDRLARATFILGLFALVAALLNEPLRARHWVLSVPMLGLYSFCLIWTLSRLTKMGGAIRLTAFALFLVCLTVLTRALAGPEGYSHVFSLVAAKVRCFGVAPEDPSLLDFDTRALWTGPFESPTLIGLCVGFTFPILLALYPAYRLVKSSSGGRSAAEPGIGDPVVRARSMILFLAVAFIALFLLFRRLEVFLILFLAVLAAGCWVGTPRWGKGVLLLVILFMGSEAWRFDRGTISARWWEGLLPKTDGKALVNQDPSIADLFDLIERLTEPDAAIVARYPLSPMILAYTGRSVVIHAIFESSENRRKIEEVTRAFFRPEGELLELCRRMGARYVIYEANTLFDTSSGSDRYMTVSMEIEPEWVAFFPHELEHFCLIGQTRYFRIFRVLGMAEPRADRASVKECSAEERPGAGGVGPDGSYSPQFDPALFGVRPERTIDEDQMRRSLADIAETLKAYNRSVSLYASGRYEESSLILMQIVKQIPRSGEARSLLYRNMIQLGNQGFRGGQFDRARAFFSEAARLRPEDPLPHLLLGSSHASRGKLELAEAEYLQALALDPESPEVYEKLGMIYIERRDAGKARFYLERCLEIDPDQPSARRLLRSIEEMR